MVVRSWSAGEMVAVRERFGFSSVVVMNWGLQTGRERDVCRDSGAVGGDGAESAAASDFTAVASVDQSPEPQCVTRAKISGSCYRAGRKTRGSLAEPSVVGMFNQQQ